MQKLLHYSKLLMILFLVTGLFSCERLSELYRISDTNGTKVVKGNDETGDETPDDPCGEPVIIPLFSRDNQEFSPGHLIVTNDDKFLSVKFEVTEGDWKIDMIYLYVGLLDFIPLDETGSYPAFWAFKNQYADIPVASYTFELALEDLDDCFKILAQARFVDSKENIVVTWTKGTNPDNWPQGPYLTYYCKDNCKEPCEEPCEEPKEKPCEEPCGGCKMGIYRTQTPGGWGAKAAGNNPGSYRDANFANAFPEGLIVGDLSNNFIKLTSADAIEKLLPTGGKPAVLTDKYTEPDPAIFKIKNVLVGHMVALKLSVGFDNYDKDFGKAEGSLAYLIVADGFGFDGMNIKDILTEADLLLGGGSSSYSPSQMTEILTKINEYFVDGKKLEKFKLFDCN